MKKLGIISLSLLLAHTTSYSSDTMQRALDHISYPEKTTKQTLHWKYFNLNGQNPATQPAIIAAHYLASNPAQSHEHSGTGAREAIIHKLAKQAKQEKIIPLLTEKNSGILNKFDMQLADTLMEQNIRAISDTKTIPRSLTLPSNISRTSKLLNSLFDPNAQVQYVTVNLEDLHNPKNESLRDVFNIAMLSRDHETKDIVKWLLGELSDDDLSDSESIEETLNLVRQVSNDSDNDFYDSDFANMLSTNQMYKNKYHHNDNKTTYDLICNNPELKKFCYNNKSLPELSLILDAGDVSTLNIDLETSLIPTDSVMDTIRVKGTHLKTILNFPIAFYNHKINTLILPDSVEEIGDSVFDSSCITTFQSSQNLSKVGDNFLADSDIKHLILPSFIASRGQKFLDDCKLLETIKINEELFEDLQGENFFNKQQFPNLKQITLLRPHGLTSTKYLS